MEREYGFTDEGETGEQIGNATAPLSAEVTGYTPFGVAVVYAMVAVQRAKELGEGKEKWETLHVLDCCEIWLKNVSDAAKK